MIESVSHLFSSTTCAATHVDGEGGESDLAPTDPDDCPEACDVWGETSDLVRTDWSVSLSTVLLCSMSLSPMVVGGVLPAPYWRIKFLHVLKEQSSS